MTASLDPWTRSWRGPLLAALIALAAALPGALLLPATDRSETRLAEASAQMLEDRDFTAAAVDDQAPDRRPLGVHWLQAASVAIASSAEARAIWAFRIPAVAGAMAAAAACAWGGAALFGPGTGFLAGAMLGAGFLASSAGVIDASGALLCAGVTLAVSALARLRLASESARKAGPGTRICLWLGLALAAIAGGPAGAAVPVLAAAVLWLIERKGAWLGTLGWRWGPILLAALVGPSLVAGAIEGDNGLPAFLPLGGTGQPTPGLQVALAPLLAFPFALLLPAGLLALGKARRDPDARFALAWLLPAWLILEFTRNQPPAGGLLFYGALCWLCALAVRDGVGPIAAKIGAALQALAAAVLIAALLYLAQRFGGGQALAWSAAACVLIAAAALGGSALLLRGRTGAALTLAGTLGLAAHGVALAGLGPHLDGLWTAQRTAAALKAANLDPRDGVMPGPVAVTGFGEPSLTFALGGQTEALEPAEAAAAIRTGRPAIVEARQEDAFLKALASPASVTRAAEVEGFDYANGSMVRLIIYSPAKTSSELK